MKQIIKRVIICACFIISTMGLCSCQNNVEQKKIDFLSNFYSEYILGDKNGSEILSNVCSPSFYNSLDMVNFDKNIEPKKQYALHLFHNGTPSDNHDKRLGALKKVVPIGDDYFAVAYLWNEQNYRVTYIKVTINDEGKYVMDKLLNNSPYIAIDIESSTLKDKIRYTFLRYKYDKIDKLFVNGLTKVELDGKCGYINHNGKEIVPCIYDSIGDFSSNEYTTVKHNGKYGYISRFGDEKLPCKYDFIGEFHQLSELLTVKLNGKWGFINKQGEEAIACIYDEIKIDKYFDWVKVRVNNKWGCIDTQGEIVIPCIYDIVKLCDHDRTTVKLNEKWGCINTYGDKIAPCIYNEIEIYDDYLTKINLDGKWGIINVYGNKITPCIYDKIEKFENNENLIKVKSNDKWGCINKSDYKTSPCTYDIIDDFFEGFAKVKSEGKWGYIDENGQLRIRIAFSEADDFRDSTAFVTVNGVSGILNKNGTFKPFNSHSNYTIPGREPERKPLPRRICQTCNGSGRMIISGGGMSLGEQTCPACGGLGTYVDPTDAILNR